METIIISAATEWASKTNPILLTQNLIIFYVAYRIVNRAFKKHFEVVGSKFDKLTEAIEHLKETMHSGFLSNDNRMTAIEGRVERLEEN